MNKNISYVFVRNKLISTDSFLPVALEMKKKLGIATNFVTFDKKTFNVINNNIVIKDTINSIGSLIYPVTKIQKAMLLVRVIFDILTKKVFLFHFGHLNNGVIKILPLLNPKRTFFTEPDSSGFSKFMFDVDYARSKREHSLEKYFPPQKGYLLAFGDEWLWLKDPRVKNLPKIIVRHPRAWQVWKDHLQKISDIYIDSKNLKPKVVTFVLGFFGPTNITLNDESIKNCFIETLEVLSTLPDSENMTIFLKPHPVTSLDELKKITSSFPGLDLRVTYVHPSLLAIHSDLAICNLYSTAIYDFSILGVPTVEYAEYCPEALELSKGTSCRPEYVDLFINRNKDKLKFALQSERLTKKDQLKVEANSSRDFLELLNSL